jgi:hypothetical protein
MCRSRTSAGHVCCAQAVALAIYKGAHEYVPAGVVEGAHTVAPVCMPHAIIDAAIHICQLPCSRQRRQQRDEVLLTSWQQPAASMLL